MLTIQPVNFTKHYSFKGVDNTLDDNDYLYPKEQYESDKTKLEEHLDELNEVIENTQVPKPVRAIGKIASVGIGAALGFVGMRFGAQGIVKMGKEGISYLKGLAKSPKLETIKNASSSFLESVKVSLGKFFEKIKNNSKVQRLATKFTDKYEKFEQSSIYKNVKEFGNRFVKWTPVQKVCEYVQKVFAKIKGVTSQQVENGTVNLFAVSGGVTGGITALQDATKGQE